MRLSRLLAGSARSSVGKAEPATNVALTLVSAASLACAGVFLSCGPAPKDEFSIIADQVPGGALLSVAAVDGEAIFVGGQLDGGASVIVHYDGASLCYEDAPTDRALWWIHSARPGEFYAVGEGGTILHSRNGVRTLESVPTESTLFGVWDSGDWVIAVGGDVFGSKKGEVWIRQDGTWSQLASDLPGVAFKVWNRWIVGDGIAYHIEGGSSTAIPTLVERFPPKGEKLTTVVGRSDSEVFAVGGTGTPVLLSWDGSAWNDVPVDLSCASMGLNGAWTEPGEDLWIAGFFGTMGRLASGAWTCATSPPTFETFHVVAKVAGEYLFAGGNFLSRGDNYGTIGRYGAGSKTLAASPCK